MRERLDLAGADPAEADVVAAVGETVERIAKDLIRSREIDRAHTIDRHILDELAAVGMFGLTVPEQYGGSGLSLRAVGSILAGLAVHDRSVATTVGLHLGLGTRPLVLGGTEAQKARLLPDFATGKTIAAFAATEPDAGSDLTAIRTRAVPDGDGFVVDGTKVYVTNGGLADVFTIAAATPTEAGGRGGRGGHGVFVLFKSDPGVRVGAEEDKLGLRGSSTTTLHLDGVRIGRDRVIGEAGAGMPRVSDALAHGRTVMAAGCVGTAKAALGKAIAHAAVRRQFGKPLIALEVVQEQIADAAARIYAMESTFRYATAREDLLEPRSLAAKVLCSEGAGVVADFAVQLHGGSGFIEETGVALILRDARVTRIFEGANDVLRVRLGLWWATVAPEVPEGAGAVASALWADARALGRDAAKRWGARIALRPRELHRLGDAAILAHATVACALRAEESGLSSDSDLAVRYADLARRELATLSRPLGDGADAARIVRTLTGETGTPAR